MNFCNRIFNFTVSGLLGLLLSASACPPDFARPADPEVMAAIVKSDKAALEVLIGKGADLGGVDENGDTPLAVAIKLANDKDAHEIPCLLAKDKETIDKKDADGKSPIALAFEKKMAAVVRCLAGNGASLNEKVFGGEQPLVWANAKKKAELREIFIKNMARNPSSRIGDAPPMIWAASKRDRELLKDLKTHGADPSLVETATGNTLLHEAVTSLEITEWVLDNTASNLNALNLAWQSPLHLAYKKKNAEVVKLLLSRGADATLVDQRGYLPNEYKGHDWEADDMSKWEISSGACLDAICHREKSKVCRDLFAQEDPHIGKHLKDAEMANDKAVFESHIKTTARAISLRLHPDKGRDGDKIIKVNECSGALKSAMVHSRNWKCQGHSWCENQWKSTCDAECMDAQDKCMKLSAQQKKVCLNSVSTWDIFSGSPQTKKCQQDEKDRVEACRQKYDSCRLHCR